MTYICIHKFYYVYIYITPSHVKIHVCLNVIDIYNILHILLYVIYMLLLKIRKQIVENIFIHMLLRTYKCFPSAL